MTELSKAALDHFSEDLAKLCDRHQVDMKQTIVITPRPPQEDKPEDKQEPTPDAPANPA